MKTLIILALSLSISFACWAADAKPEAPAVRARALITGSVFSGFGEDGPGKTKITITGDVVHTGDYFLSKDATILELLKIIGDIQPYNLAPPMMAHVTKTDGTKVSIKLDLLIATQKPVLIVGEIVGVYLPGAY